MVCATCKDNNYDCGTCFPLPCIVVKDVIYYIYYHSSRATFERIAAGCEQSFLEPVIIDAKSDFLKVVLCELKEMDKTLASEVGRKEEVVQNQRLRW